MAGQCGDNVLGSDDGHQLGSLRETSDASITDFSRSSLLSQKLSRNSFSSAIPSTLVRYRRFTPERRSSMPFVNKACKFQHGQVLRNRRTANGKVRRYLSSWFFVVLNQSKNFAPCRVGNCFECGFHDIHVSKFLRKRELTIVCVGTGVNFRLTYAGEIRDVRKTCGTRLSETQRYELNPNPCR